MNGRWRNSEAFRPKKRSPRILSKRIIWSHVEFAISINCLEHLQQSFQSSHFVKFNNFCSIFFLQQSLYFESPPKICYSELSYMKVTVAPFIIILILLSLTRLFSLLLSPGSRRLFVSKLNHRINIQIKSLHLPIFNIKAIIN
jgi:hypothetical protein